MGKKILDDTLGIDPPQVNIPPPPPPPSSVASAPDAAVAADRARRQREDADARRKRSGARSTIVTGPEGVGSSPLGVKTLVGS